MIYPHSPAQPYGASVWGATPRWPTLDRLLLVPPIHLPHRIRDVARLGREPTPWDVATRRSVGGLPSSMPAVVASMGSTPVAHDHGVALAQAAARHGVPLGIGENVATVHGYADRAHPQRPSFKERALAYLDAMGPDDGGLIVQQSVEDAMDELWWRVYADPDLAPYVAQGRVAFEAKVGQGAKPGLGGLTFVTPEQAQRLGREFHLRPIPGSGGLAERFSAPGTFTFEILESQMRHLRNDFPKARIWCKLPPARDVSQAAEAAARGGAHALVLDGAEGGTALAPRVFLDHVGLPLVAVLARVRRLGVATDLVASGGVADGAGVVKLLGLGAAAAGLGRAPLAALRESGPEGADRFFRDLHQEIQFLTYALGHLDAGAVGPEAVMAFDRDVADALGVGWTMDPFGSVPPA